MKYLGLPLGGSPKSITLWDPMVEKVQKKTTCWKKNYISLGGRTILIKTTMSNIPTYYMSIFKMPAKIIKTLEKLQKDFV